MTNLPIKDNISSADNGSTASLTWSHTIGPGSNMVLYVGILYNPFQSVTGVTYAGQAMTPHAAQGPTSVAISTYYLLNPPTGPNNVIASFNTTTGAGAVAVSYYNVAQTGTFGTVAQTSGTTTNSSN